MTYKKRLCLAVAVSYIFTTTTADCVRSRSNQCYLIFAVERAAAVLLLLRRRCLLRDHHPEISIAPKCPGRQDMNDLERTKSYHATQAQSWKMALTQMIRWAQAANQALDCWTKACNLDKCISMMCSMMALIVYGCHWSLVWHVTPTCSWNVSTSSGDRTEISIWIVPQDLKGSRLAKAGYFPDLHLIALLSLRVSHSCSSLPIEEQVQLSAEEYEDAKGAFKSSGEGASLDLAGIRRALERCAVDRSILFEKWNPCRQMVDMGAVLQQLLPEFLAIPSIIWTFNWYLR